MEGIVGEGEVSELEEPNNRQEDRRAIAWASCLFLVDSVGLVNIVVLNLVRPNRAP